MARNPRVLPITAFVLAVVGLALLVVEVVRTVNGSALGSLGEVLLWAGVGFVVVAIVLLTMTLLSEQDDSTADAPVAAEGEPAV